jgi:uncharacterized protein YndB with AHSA1/START domain
MAEAELARFIDRFTMEYVRTYRHPIDRVWRAITNPKEFRVWFIRGEVELRQGGAYRFESGDFSGKVLEIEPPRRIRFGGAQEGGYFEYQLDDVPGGTRMRFVNHFPPGGRYKPVPDDLGGDLPGGPDTPWMPGFVGGWHEHFDSLADVLDGVGPGSRLPTTEFTALAGAWVNEGVKSGRIEAQRAPGLVLSFRRTERWNELNKIYREHIKRTIPPK